MSNKYTNNLLVSAGLYELKYVSKEEIKNYPEEQIIEKDGYHFFLDKKSMTNEDLKIAMAAIQITNVKIIKNIMIFNLILTLISIALSIYMVTK